MTGSWTLKPSNEEGSYLGGFIICLLGVLALFGMPLVGLLLGPWLFLEGLGHIDKARKGKQ